jgi:hypothetical protein
MACIALWLFFEWWISWEAFCHQPENYSAAYQPPEKYECVFRGPVMLILRSLFGWWDHFFDKPDSYVALFTGLLFVSTTALWWSTRKLWKAGDAQIAIAKQAADAAVLNAKAAIGVELPIIIFELELHRESGTTGIVTDAPGKLSILKILYKNMGRSAAEMLRLCVEWRVIDILPERAVFERMIDFAPGSMLDSAVAEQTIPMELQGAEVAAIKNKTKSLWVYGFLRYKDFIGDQHQTPYCARWDLGTKRFIYDPNIPSTYIQKT